MSKKEGKKSVGKLKRRKKVRGAVIKPKNQIPSKQTKIQKVIKYFVFF